MAEATFKATTKDQVKAMAADGKSAQEIAEALGKTPATIYNHLRNLGVAPKGKRGRPRKSEDGAQPAKAATRKRPSPKTRTAPQTASRNGHSEVLLPELRDQVKDAIQKRQREITRLEKVLSTLEA